MGKREVRDNAVRETVSRTEFVNYLANKHDIPKTDAAEIVRIFIEGIQDLVADQMRVSLQGFGAFYPQLHKGQVIQFDAKRTRLADYYICKFSASAAMNTWLRAVMADPERASCVEQWLRAKAPAGRPAKLQKVQT